jgi:hypothetical protein
MREWAFAALIFGILLLYPIWNGYPFLFPDSWGYYGVCPDLMRSPVLGCALRPATLAAGPWAYVAVQCAAAALALAYLRGPVLGGRHGLAMCLALLASGLGFFTGWLMADAWSLLGLIGLFAVATGRFGPGAALLLSFACATHLGNFPIYGAAALMMLPFVAGRLKYAARVLLCLALAAAAVFGLSLFRGQPRHGGPSLNVMLASRILHDVPRVLEEKCRNAPGFELCAQKEAVLKYAAEDHQSFTWNTPTNLGLGWEKADRLSREIVLFSLREMPRFFRDHLEAALANTAALLFDTKLSNGFEPFGPGSVAVEDLRATFPADVDAYLRSHQADGSLERLMQQMDRSLGGLVRLAAVACMIAVATSWRTRSADPLIRLAALALAAGLANAFIMSNLSGVYGRYQARLAFLLLFPGFALLGRALGHLSRGWRGGHGEGPPQFPD